MFLVAGLLAPDAGVAAVDQCPGFVRPPLSISVRIEEPRVRVHHDLGHAELGERWVHGEEGRLLGFTSSRVEIESRAEYGALRVGNRYCFWVDSITVMLRCRPFDVYVAREYDVGSCPYKAILDHEQEHVALAEQYLEAYAPRFRAALASPLIPKAFSPLLVESPEEAQRNTQEMIELLLAPVAEELKADMSEAEAELDRPEGYQRIRGRCEDW